MRVWDDNEFPLAYLITFRTYGTWLHGDERTSIDRYMNNYSGPRIPHSKGRETFNRSIMSDKPVTLNRQQIVTNSLKAYSTRRLREGGLWKVDSSPWSDK